MQLKIVLITSLKRIPLNFKDLSGAALIAVQMGNFAVLSFFATYLSSPSEIQAMYTKCWLKILAMLLFLTFHGCTPATNEKKLQQWQDSLNQKEQELNLRERILDLKEAELSKKSAYIDSTVKKDTMSMYDTSLIGAWDVKMVCIEATCTGSAVGDTKREQWIISMQGTNFIAKAISGNNQSRIYTGIYTGNTLELIAQAGQAVDHPAAKMVARLHIVNPKRMDGQREITRENDCKIIYTMEMNKQ